MEPRARTWEASACRWPSPSPRVSSLALGGRGSPSVMRAPVAGVSTWRLEARPEPQSSWVAPHHGSVTATARPQSRPRPSASRSAHPERGLRGADHSPLGSVRHQPWRRKRHVCSVPYEPETGQKCVQAVGPLEWEDVLEAGTCHKASEPLCGRRGRARAASPQGRHLSRMGEPGAQGQWG